MSRGSGRKALWIALAALLVLLLLIGLGAFLLLRDDGPSKEEFIGDADAVCRDQIEALNALDGSDAVPFIQGMIDLTDEQIAGLEALEFPAEDRKLLEDYIATLERSRDLTAGALEPARNGDQDALNDISSRSQVVAEESDRLAREYGFNTCGRIALTND